MLLSVILFVPIYLMCRIVPRLESDTMLDFLYYVGYAVNALSPDFFYRGIENMKVITVRTILIKFVFVILIFVFLKEPSDYYVIPDVYKRQHYYRQLLKLIRYRFILLGKVQRRVILRTLLRNTD